MKYSILGFQQDKLIKANLDTEDALILRQIKDMYSTSKMEFLEQDGVRYMWINYSYLLEQLPIIGTKRNLMRKIEKYGNELYVLRLLKHERKGEKGNYSYIAPTEKLDDLQDFDLMTESHKGYDRIAQPLGQNRITLMTESHNKDSSISDSSISDSKSKTFLSDSDEFRLSELLFKFMNLNNPKCKTPNIQSWCGHIEKMIRIDKRSVEDIQLVIEWSQQDSFWKQNILSTAKLREKFDQLYLKASDKKEFKLNSNTGRKAADF